MSAASFMLIAGEPSGDALGAELVTELKAALAGDGFAPQFFGAGGPRLAAAGVALELDLTRHAVTGFVEVLKQVPKFRRILSQLLELAWTRQPDVIVMVDFQAFNRRFAHALRRRLTQRQREFNNWRPRLVQFVSPQVWGSRPGRAYDLAEDVDLLLCLFPFEKAWYARHTPRLRVAVVGHPLLDRHGPLPPVRGMADPSPMRGAPLIVLLPGSRESELRRHLPVMLAAARLLAARQEVRFRVVLPDDTLRSLVEAQLQASRVEVELQVGGLREVLVEATVAIASTGTVTLECALFGVPTVAMYITSPVTYFIARQLATVKYIAMPNVLANLRVMPEFLQFAATPENLAEAATHFLRHPFLRDAVRRKLDEVVAQLGGPGASRRAARAIADLLGHRAKASSVPVV